MAIIKLRGNNVDIDDELIPLIKELNNVGLKTLFCCSGHDDKAAYICFDMNINNLTVYIADGQLTIHWRRSKRHNKIGWFK